MNASSPPFQAVSPPAPVSKRFRLVVVDFLQLLNYTMDARRGSVTTEQLTGHSARWWYKRAK